MGGIINVGLWGVKNRVLLMNTSGKVNVARDVSIRGCDQEINDELSRSHGLSFA